MSIDLKSKLAALAASIVRPERPAPTSKPASVKPGAVMVSGVTSDPSRTVDRRIGDSLDRRHLARGFVDHAERDRQAKVDAEKLRASIVIAERANVRRSDWRFIGGTGDAPETIDCLVFNRPHDAPAALLLWREAERACAMNDVQRAAANISPAAIAIAGKSLADGATSDLRTIARDRAKLRFAWLAGNPDQRKRCIQGDMVLASTIVGRVATMAQRANGATVNVETPAEKRQRVNSLERESAFIATFDGSHTAAMNATARIGLTSKDHAQLADWSNQRAETLADAAADAADTAADETAGFTTRSRAAQRAERLLAEAQALCDDAERESANAAK